MNKKIYKWKGYAHFDNRISIKRGRQYAENPKYVIHHGFYPLLHQTLKLRKIRNDKNGMVRTWKKREIYYCAHIDRYIYQYYAYRLNEVYNEYCKKTLIDQCSVAYRNNREGESNINFAKEAFDFIKGHHNCLVVVGDFTDFFDNIEFIYLKNCLCRVLGESRLSDDWYNVFQNICHYSYVDVSDILKEYKKAGRSVTIKQLNRSGQPIWDFLDIRKNQRKWIHIPKDETKQPKTYGIPQGSPISGVLANVYMIDFDRKILDFCENCNGLYRRYSDDFLIAIPNVQSKEIQQRIDYIFSIVKEIAAQGRLELKAEKTHCYLKAQSINEYSLDGKEIIHDGSAISFLGFTLNGNQITIRSKTLSKYYNKVIHKIKRIQKIQGKTRKTNGTQINISNKSVHNVYGKIYRVVNSNGENRTFMTYVRRSSKIFKGEDKIKKSYKNRHHQIDRLINRARQPSKNLKDDEKYSSDE